MLERSRRERLKLLLISIKRRDARVEARALHRPERLLDHVVLRRRLEMRHGAKGEGIDAAEPFREPPRRPERRPRGRRARRAAGDGAAFPARATISSPPPAAARRPRRCRERKPPRSPPPPRPPPRCSCSPPSSCFRGALRRRGVALSAELTLPPPAVAATLPRVGRSYGPILQHLARRRYERELRISRVTLRCAKGRAARVS